MQCDALAFLSLLAQRLVLTQWKSSKPPKWVESIMVHLKLEKLNSVSHKVLSKEYMEAYPPLL